MSEVEFDAEPEESDAVVKAGRPRRPSTPPNIRAIVWARAAGRCQFRGCNKLLIGDLVSGKSDLNASYIAHIVADSVDGPRGHKSLSSELSTRPGNLMLMCDPHHRLIDGPATRHEYPNKIELDFAIQLQEQSKWCWAATASSISHHYEPNASRSQNEIVGRALKIPPPWIPDESWNQPAPMMTGLRIVRCDAGTQCDTASFGVS
ncbi:hypothetical protein NOJ05_13140 [Neorhizobium galegae]|uniref:papain-like cysteine protease family protein n=1 Tax=Neorhizobium galegae TaxID=399 RepID=UPI0006218B6C|nr:hypothetical protein [Neorhizobium galegae]MCQ1778148.1 hypothetical protein [Neorhizobium galegae]MCQ1796889.1 hypothetical protein [Neorhizobium galegae]CDZ28134.1 Hypothetical protein NGAL_HAMBI490_29920 [Neorhizobium galegae bv. officinalis]